MSLVSVHLGFAQAVNGVGIGFAAPRVEGQQKVVSIAPPTIEPMALPKLNATCTAAPAISSPPPWPASVISNCCGAEVKNNPMAIQNVSTAVIG